MVCRAFTALLKSVYDASTADSHLGQNVQFAVGPSTISQATGSSSFSSLFHYIMDVELYIKLWKPGSTPVRDSSMNHLFRSRETGQVLVA